MASVGVMELLVLGLICLVPLALALIALVVVLVVRAGRGEERQPGAGEEHASGGGVGNG